MKTPRWYRKYCILCCIKKQLWSIDLMGSYRFIGEWGDRILYTYNDLITQYNKNKFWWQKAKKLV